MRLLLPRHFRTLLLRRRRNAAVLGRLCEIELFLHDQGPRKRFGLQHGIDEAGAILEFRMEPIPGALEPGARNLFLLHAVSCGAGLGAGTGLVIAGPRAALLGGAAGGVAGGGAGWAASAHSKKRKREQKESRKHEMAEKRKKG